MLRLITKNAQGHIILTIGEAEVASSNVTAEMITPSEFDFIVRAHPEAEGRLPSRSAIEAARSA